MIVVDTSALIELLADGRGWRAVVAARLAAEEAAGERLFAPALVDAEAAKVLKRLAGKELPEERATDAIKELAAMDLVRCTFGHLLLRI
ncbi:MULTISPECIES: PIN domain-containing protein [unclassified Frankia]|uniref:PIN domain-containing protein n=1 Tax=unclassified Frankia TaxID=2632575 RepID=UPI002AD31E95|nr:MULTISPECIES: PIN domain-containing protein [unclassified Frankia]